METQTRYRVSDLAKACGVSPQAISKTLKKHPELNQFKTVEGRYIFFGEEVLNWFKERYNVPDETESGCEVDECVPIAEDTTENTEKIRLLEGQVKDLEERLKNACEALQKAEEDKKVAQSHVERLMGLLEREQAISMACASRGALPEPEHAEQPAEEPVITEETPDRQRGLWGRFKSLWDKKKGTV